MTAVIIPDPALDSIPELSYLRFHPPQLPDLLAMLGRCSSRTLYQRFHGATDGTFHARDLARRTGHLTVGAWTRSGCIGIATLAPGEGIYDLGVLIEDAWQRRGVGAVLLRRLAELAAAAGISEWRAEVLAENGWVLGVLSRIGRVDASVRWGEYSVRIELLAG